MLSHLRPALASIALFTVLTGLLYPACVTLAAQAAFPVQARGSLIERRGVLVGSTLIGQPFDAPGYFWGRPSGTHPAYDGAASCGANLGPTSAALTDAVKARIDALRAADPDATDPVPVDLVTTSASGLDPHISPAGAFYQVRRVARARGLDESAVRRLVDGMIEDRQHALLGEARVDVLLLNLALDELDARRPSPPHE